MGRKRIPEDRLIELQNKLCLFSPRSAEKLDIIKNFANLYGVSINSEKAYINWLLSQCLDKKTKPEDVFTEDAIEYMADKFSTPLQINHYAWISLVKVHQIGQQAVNLETLNNIISTELDGLEAKLKRSGYDIKAISETVNAKPAEIKALFNGRLVSDRAKEIQDEILKLGIAGGY